MPAATPAIFRNTVGGYAMFGTEAGELSSLASGVGAAPSLALAGLCDLPTMRDPNNPQIMRTIGSRQGVGALRMGREPSANLVVRVGSKDILRCGLQTSGLGDIYGLPSLTLAAGHTSSFGSARAFSWLLRYAMINSVTLQFQEGQPITATIDFWGLALDSDGATQAVNQAALAALPKGMSWHHSYFSINGNSYRDVIGSLSLQWTNGLVREGERNELGDNNILSRTSYAILPGDETVNVSYTFKQELPAGLTRQAANSRDWGAVVCTGTDAAINGTNTLAATISNNLLGEQTMNGVQPGQKFSFAATTTSSVLAIAA